MTKEHQLYKLGEVFRQVFRMINADWNRNVGAGISAQQAHILEILETKGPQKVSDLAEALNITLSAVTGLSDRLYASGFIKRERPEHDRRIVLLEITREGSQVLKNVHNHRKSILEKYYGSLPEQDIEHLIRIYLTILEKMDSNPKE